MSSAVSMFLWYLLYIFQDNPERIVNTEKVYWLTALYGVFPLVIMVISYSLICYKIKLSNNSLSCQETKTFNKHKSEVSNTLITQNVAYIFPLLKVRFTRMIGIIFGNYILFTFVPAVILVFR